ADEVPDHDEDEAMSVRTPCVVYGRVTASLLAATFYIVSCLSSLALYAYETEVWSAGRVIMLIVAATLYSWVFWKYLTLARISKSIDEAKSASVRTAGIKKLKKVSNTPAEIFVTSVGALLLAVGETFL